MGKRWTESEDQLLRENLPKHGPGWKGWADLLPGRTPAAILARKGTLGIEGPRSKPAPRTKLWVRADPVPRQWTDEQRLTLVDCAREMAAKTGHPLSECTAELKRLTEEYRRGRL